MEDSSINKKNEIGVLRELGRMLKKPWCTSFVLYLIFFIVFVNGASVLCAFIDNNAFSKDDVSKSLAFYSISILVPSILTLILELHDIINKVSFSIICVMVLVAQIIIIPKAYSGSLLLAIIGTIISLVYWILANRDNVYYNDKSFNDSIKKKEEQHGRGW